MRRWKITSFRSTERWRKPAAENVEPVLLKDDHGFKMERLQLQKTIVTWLYEQIK